MNNSEPLKNWYSQDLAQKKSWYSEAADAYNQVRPRYPQQLIDRVVELAQLQKDATILEIGCGPGTATTAFAKLGYSMVCLEPNQKSYQLAKLNCNQYQNVEIINTTFEEWELDAERFNAVLAATSFHWVSPEIKYQKTAAALQDQGYLILLWNIPPQPNYEVYQVLDEIYQTFAPSIVGYEDIQIQQENLRKQGQAAIDSGHFTNLISEQLVCEVTYSIDDYLLLLSTLSPYIAIDRQQRDLLFAGLRETLQRTCGNTLQTSYLSVFQVAQKISNQPRLL